MWISELLCANNAEIVKTISMIIDSRESKDIEIFNSLVSVFNLLVGKVFLIY